MSNCGDPVEIEISHTEPQLQFTTSTVSALDILPNHTITTLYCTGVLVLLCSNLFFVLAAMPC